MDARGKVLVEVAREENRIAGKLLWLDAEGGKEVKLLGGHGGGGARKHQRAWTATPASANDTVGCRVASVADPETNQGG